MNVALRRPQMSREQFLDWASAREDRYEFDGVQPVAMTGGTIRHNTIAQNVYFALRTRLKAQSLSQNVFGMVRWRVFASTGAERPMRAVSTGAQQTRARWPFRARLETGSKRCTAHGPHAGLATIDDAVRYPDALVTCTTFPDTARLVPGVVIVFEVVSPTSGRIDRIIKVREYNALPTIRRYVILEYTSMDLTVFTRQNTADPWTASTRTADEALQLPELGLEIPIAAFYEGTDVPRPTDEIPAPLQHPADSAPEAS